MPWCFSEFLNLIRASDGAAEAIDLQPGEPRVIGRGVRASLYFVTRGAALFSFDRERFERVAEGDLLIALPGQQHAIADGSGDTSNIVRVAFDVRWPGGFDDRLLRPAIKVDAARHPIRMPALAQSLLTPAASVLLSRVASLALVSAIKRHPKGLQMLRIANDRGPIARAVQLMEVHHRVPWTVDMLATKVGMGRSTFAARFAEEMQKTPIEVLTEIRMDLAHRMLLQTHLKIAVIADRIGYQSEAAFNRRFAAHFGVTPGRLRRDGPQVTAPRSGVAKGIGSRSFSGPALTAANT